MDVRSVTEYRTVKLWTLFTRLFKINEPVFFSSSFRNNDTTYNWVHVFDPDGKHLGDMNRDYFYELEKGKYIERK